MLMDMITGLPLLVDLITGKTCDVILVIMDRFMKYAIYILMTKWLISSSLVELLLYYIIHPYSIF